MTTNVINVLNRICTSSLFLFQQANYPVTWISYLEFQELLNFFLIICKILDRLLCHRTEAHEKFKHLCTLKCFIYFDILAFWGKLLPHVRTFHRVSFDIPFCDMNHSPQTYTFWSKTPHCSNSGDISNQKIK